MPHTGATVELIGGVISLKQALYDTIEKADLKHTMLKTVFLVTAFSGLAFKHKVNKTRYANFFMELSAMHFYYDQTSTNRYFTPQL